MQHFVPRALRSALSVFLGGVPAVFTLSGLVLVLWVHALSAQGPAPGPNSDPTYQALRNIAPTGDSISVNNLDLKRDAGTFHLHSGTICFVPPVNGKVTGAVFSGDGNFVLEPPMASERNSLKLLTKEDQFSEKFSQMVLRFTDSTYDEIKKAGSGPGANCDSGAFKDSQHATRHKLKDNLEIRLLQDVLSPESGGYFIAFIHGKKYDGQELYEIDPHEGRDQVQFTTYDENKYGRWASFPMDGAHKGGIVGPPIRIEHQQLETTLEKSGNLIGKAKTKFTANRDGLRVAQFDVYPTLRVRSVKGEDGQALSFIQEDKNDDANFAVIVPRPVSAGDHFTVEVEYQGKGAVSNRGGGNYYLEGGARDSWYPSNLGSSLGEYALYDMTFRIPKGMRLPLRACASATITTAART